MSLPIVETGEDGMPIKRFPGLAGFNTKLIPIFKDGVQVRWEEIHPLDQRTEDHVLPPLGYDPISRDLDRWEQRARAENRCFYRGD